MTALKSVEVCAGAGGQALGLEQAGYQHLACVEIDPHACATLRENRPDWNVIQADIRASEIAALASTEWRGVDLLAGGVPCPPFSVAGKQLGHEDERDLFPTMIALTEAARPKALLIENVRGLLGPIFGAYRQRIEQELAEIGYIVAGWQLLNASDYHVPQLRPRVAMVALRPEYLDGFSWPIPDGTPPPTVGEALYAQMGSRGWPGALQWKLKANQVAPTLVGGSMKHGGPDLGPTRAKAAWAKMGVDALTLAEEPPGPDFTGVPRLTVQMAARLQGFPRDWKIVGKKTQAYRQVGNAFPPPVARAIGQAVRAALTSQERLQVTA